MGFTKSDAWLGKMLYNSILNPRTEEDPCSSSNAGLKKRIPTSSIFYFLWVPRPVEWYQSPQLGVSMWWRVWLGNHFAESTISNAAVFCTQFHRDTQNNV